LLLLLLLWLFFLGGVFFKVAPSDLIQLLHSVEAAWLIVGGLVANRRRKKDGEGGFIFGWVSCQ
jgi:hypothetical protein